MDNMERIKSVVAKAYTDAARTIDINSMKAATLLDCKIPEDNCKVVLLSIDSVKIMCTIIAKIEVNYLLGQHIELEVPITINKITSNDSDVIIYHEVLSQLNQIEMAMELRDTILDSLSGFNATSYMIGLMFGSHDQYRKKIAISLSKHFSK
jgi:hypothetical protein